MRRIKLEIAVAGAVLAYAAVALADQVIPDDLIVQGSICSGFDCVNNESFGFDTIRLRENNLRIAFDDTSATGSFPYNDWAIFTNDSANGGLNHFSVEDTTAGRVPFRIEAGARANALHLDSTGNVGLGTTAPSQGLHLAQGNTPAVRLDQDGSGGWFPQVWDVAGNEANFFVRDATNGTLPFRIQPGAPQSSIYIRSTGNVGLGRQNPTAFLHIVRGAGSGVDLQQDGGIRLEMTPVVAAEALGVVVSNNGPVTNAFIDQNGDQVWYEKIGQDLRTGSSAYEISEASTGVVGLRVEANGDVTIGGVLTEGSSRTIKHGVHRVDVHDVLQTVRSLPIQRWRYITDPEQAEHLGPMAEDFHAAFGLGADDKHISTIDTSGVALAAVQALGDQVAELEAERAELRAENERLTERLDRLESLVQGLVAKR